MDLYCDGGVIGANPSPVGGMWAFCEVVNGEIRQSDAHIVTPGEVGLPTVSNNVTELYAAIRALESQMSGGDVTLHTDSIITMRRVNDPVNARFNGIPDWMRERTIAAVQRLRTVRTILVGGHPTRAELESGIKAKNGLPVSKFNVWCDRKCQEVRDLYAPELRKAKAAADVSAAETMLQVAKTIRDVELDLGPDTPEVR